MDATFATGSFDAILVEADGARNRLVKAPAEYEPAIPSSSTVVVAVFPEAALGAPIEHVAHRPELVAAVVGCGTDERMTPARAARLIGSPAGYRKAVPPDARFLAAIVRTTRTPSPAACDLVVRLRSRGIRACELRVPPAA